MDHHVTEARNGTEALRLCAAEPPEVVLTDLIMPEKEGLETIAEIRRQFPELKVIAMSGGGRGQADDYLRIARRLGAVQTLSKPFSTSEMAAAIASLSR
jgi:YesN/AraC family two-component response regulator